MKSLLIGFDSKGLPRIQGGNTIVSRFRFDNDGTCCGIGRLGKKDIVRTVTGFSVLKDLPLIGCFKFLEGESTKKSKCFVILEVARPYPNMVFSEKIQEKKNKILKDFGKVDERNTFKYHQYVIDSPEAIGDK